MRLGIDTCLLFLGNRECPALAVAAGGAWDDRSGPGFGTADGSLWVEGAVCFGLN